MGKIKKENLVNNKATGKLKHAKITPKRCRKKKRYDFNKISNVNQNVENSSLHNRQPITGNESFIRIPDYNKEIKMNDIQKKKKRCKNKNMKIPKKDLNSPSSSFKSIHSKVELKSIKTKKDMKPNKKTRNKVEPTIINDKKLNISIINQSDCEIIELDGSIDSIFPNNSKKKINLNNEATKEPKVESEAFICVPNYNAKMKRSNIHKNSKKQKDNKSDKSSKSSKIDLNIPSSSKAEVIIIDDSKSSKTTHNNAEKNIIDDKKQEILSSVSKPTDMNDNNENILPKNNYCAHYQSNCEIIAPNDNYNSIVYNNDKNEQKLNKRQLNNEVTKEPTVGSEAFICVPDYSKKIKMHDIQFTSTPKRVRENTENENGSKRVKSSENDLNVPSTSTQLIPSNDETVEETINSKTETICKENNIINDTLPENNYCSQSNCEFITLDETVVTENNNCTEKSIINDTLPENNSNCEFVTLDETVLTKHNNCTDENITLKNDEIDSVLIISDENGTQTENKTNSPVSTEEIIYLSDDDDDDSDDDLIMLEEDILNSSIVDLTNEADEVSVCFWKQFKKHVKRKRKKLLKKTNLSNIGQLSTIPKQDSGLRRIFIDGSNVAHINGKVNFSVERLKLCIDYFLQRGHIVRAILPNFRNRAGKTTNPKLLKELDERGLLIFTPSRMVGKEAINSYDDRFIVQCAKMFNGIIVSRDGFVDLLRESPLWKETIKNCVLPFVWVDEAIIFPLDPLGRNGPHLEEFLKHH